jgi:hypothetical protein
MNDKVVTVVLAAGLAVTTGALVISVAVAEDPDPPAPAVTTTVSSDLQSMVIRSEWRREEVCPPFRALFDNSADRALLIETGVALYESSFEDDGLTLTDEGRATVRRLLEEC